MEIPCIIKSVVIINYETSIIYIWQMASLLGDFVNLRKTAVDHD